MKKKTVVLLVLVAICLAVAGVIGIVVSCPGEVTTPVITPTPAPTTQPTTTPAPTQPAPLLPTRAEVEAFLLSEWRVGICRVEIEESLQQQWPNLSIRELPLAPGGSCYIIVDVQEGEFFIQGSDLEPLVEIQ